MVTVKRDGRTWGIYVNGKLVEGGFFSKDAAVTASKETENGNDCERTIANINNQLHSYVGWRLHRKIESK